MVETTLLVNFLVSWFISAIIIHLATKFVGARKGFSTSLIASLLGSIIYGLAAFFIGTGFIASLIAFVAWLLALRSLYNVGWIRAILISLLASILTGILSLLLFVFF